MESMKNLIQAAAAVMTGRMSEDAAVKSLLGPDQMPKGKPVRNTRTKAPYDHRKARAKRQMAKASRKRNRAA